MGDRVRLSYLEGMAHQPWFLHLGYYRPHPPFIAPAPYNTFYDPAEVPAPVRAASPEIEGSSIHCWRITYSH